MATLEQQLEAVLFYKAAPLKRTVLTGILKCSDVELIEAVAKLTERLQGGATRLLATDTELELVTAPEHDELIESLRKDELKRDIGKAGAETLAIILYRGPVGRGEIDRIRGVNSSFILRNLLVRGLVERTGEGRSIMYKPTAALYAHLGVNERTALPEFESIMNSLSAYEAAQTTE